VEKDQLWSISTPILNQLNTNSCTGNAVAQFFNTDYAAPVRKAKGVNWLTEAMALQFYSKGTHEEDDPSDYYPPNDNGSTGLDVAKAAVDLGWADKYQHTFTFDQFRSAIATQPVCVGTLWSDSMFTPDHNGLVTVGDLSDQSNVAGGHEYLALGISYTLKQCRFLTSWGAGFGLNGQFMITFDDFENLLNNQGDVIVLHGVGL
jgi:hypothetical protein